MSVSRVLVTGGAGYVGSRLVPKLLAVGYGVNVLDLYWYGESVLAECRSHPKLTEVKGDLRDPAAVARALAGCDAVIHLACISNDPSFELDPALGKSINYDAFRPLVRAAKQADAPRPRRTSSLSARRRSGRARRRTAGDRKLTDGLPFQAGKDLHLIQASFPF